MGSQEPKRYYGRKNAAPAAGGDGKWHFDQKGDEVQMRYCPAGGAPLTKQDVCVIIKSNELSVIIGDGLVVDSRLWGAV